ncbi:NUDIX domain-containing protein [Nocardia sp. FBN12]|uniref:NUDIX domain-containing protein n=1 Tax=Nocardia sp. FBN12 TaxID=3419766 RepID=UPI003CFF7037
MDPSSAHNAGLITAMESFDDLEQRHIEQALHWLAGTADIYRRIPPATPSPHLVSYVVLVDPDERGIYLGLHRKSGLHLPMGGHVEPFEQPLAAAQREGREELGVDLGFDVVGDGPLFLAVTPTVGKTAGHVDVSLWFVARGDRADQYDLDPDEFVGGRWWDLDPHGLPESDPHLGRFIRKLDTVLQSRIMR